jgi:choloylglycine hydrolase
MDWKGSTYSDLWVFLPGLDRNGGNYGDKTFGWKSKYSSVILSGRAMESMEDGCTCDGINSEGLAANLQVLDSSKFPSDGDKKMTIAAWTQYVLDRFATVQEVVDALKKEEFIITTPKIPGTDRSAKLHLAVSDANADSAIFEYEGGELKIYHGKEHKVLTNDPFYHEQLEICKQKIGGTPSWEAEENLPGTKQPYGRFTRATYYLWTASQSGTQQLRQAIADTFSIIRNAAAPSAYRNDDDPISETIWSTVIDHKNLVYYFADALSPNLWWVDLKSENLKKKIENAKKKALKIKLPYSEEDFNSGEYKDYFGDITHLFEEAEPFAFVD